MRTFEPLHDYVIVETKRESERTTASGMVVSEKQEQKPSIGTVIAVGPGRWHEGQLTPMVVRVGDRVIFQKYSVEELTVDIDAESSPTQFYAVVQTSVFARINNS